MNVIFTIGREEVKRVLLHIPLGLFTCVLGYIYSWLALAFTISFLAYELSQDWVVIDNSYKDIKGWLWGIGIGGLAVFVLKMEGILL